MTERVRERERESETQSLNQLSIHQWFRSAIHASQQRISPIGLQSLKLPPPPCAVLLVLLLAVVVLVRANPPVRPHNFLGILKEYNFRPR